MKVFMQRLKPRGSTRDADNQLPRLKSLTKVQSGSAHSIKNPSSRVLPSQGMASPASVRTHSHSLQPPSASEREAQYEDEIARLRHEIAMLKSQQREPHPALPAAANAGVHGKGSDLTLSVVDSSSESDDVLYLTGARRAFNVKAPGRTKFALGEDPTPPRENPRPRPQLSLGDSDQEERARRIKELVQELPLPPGSVNAPAKKKSVANSVGQIELGASRRAHLAQLMAVPISEADTMDDDIDRAMSQPSSPREGQRRRRERQRRRQLLDKPPDTPSTTPTRGSRASRASTKSRFPVPKSDAATTGKSLLPTRIDTSRPVCQVKLSELVMLRPLGTGGYGAVGLARLPRTEMLFAVKAVSKAHVTTPPAGGPAAVMRIRRERDALIALQGHPCVLHLYGTHVDAGHVYLITEACMGGELLRLLRRNLLNAKDAAFYAASIVLALQAAHARGIAHRDIKPENVLIDALGFARLVDWGAAVFVGGPERAGDAASGGRTLTRFGTLEYMSPEVARGKGHLGEGHTLETDWWSLGALIFEMLVGRTPCVAAAEDTDQDVLRRIARGEVIWPRQDEAQLSPAAADLLAGLLRRDETKRLGSRATGGADAVRAHAFFSSISFGAIANRSGIEPPWRPQLGSSDDNCFSPGAANPTRFVEMLNNAFAAPYDSVEWDPHFTDFASF